jgi:hypothetical protein
MSFDPLRHLASLLLVGVVAAQAPVLPHGPGSEGPPHEPEALVCRYDVTPILGPISIDHQTLSDDFCNAAAAGVVYVGEADVDWNSLAASSASFIGWKMAHRAVGGAVPCRPVRFYDDLMLAARVEAKLTGSSGARFAQAAGSQQFTSTVLSPVVLNTGAVNNDSGTPVTVTLPVPVPGVGVGSASFTVANPTANAVSVDEKRVRTAGSALSEENYAFGGTAMQIASGGNSALSGGGRARVRYTEVEYGSHSNCAVHGVQFVLPVYRASWWSSMTTF